MKTKNLGQIFTVGIIILAMCGLASAINDPIAHWKFDDGAGTTAFDSAGSNDGTLVNGPIWTGGINDGALDFDGVDDYVDCGQDSSLDITGPITVSCWVKTDQTVIAKLVAKWDASLSDGDPKQRAYVLGLNVYRVGEASFHLSSDGLTYSGFSASSSLVNNAKWHHLTGVYDGSNISIYVNGILEDSNLYSDGIFSAPDENVYIGTEDEGVYAAMFDGAIDDVRIYDRALSASEVQQLYEEYQPEQPALIAHWKFDDETGTIAVDSAGGNDGTVNGAVWDTGRIDGALDFDGVDDYVDCGDGLDFDIVTVAAWVNVSGGSGERSIVNNWDVAGYGLAYNLYDLGKFHFGIRINGHYSLVYSDAIIQQGKWYHVVGTYDGENGYLFVNGIKQADVILESGTITDSPVPLLIGANPDTIHAPDKVFNGKIDDVQIYNYALDAGEIAAIFAEGAATYHVDGVGGDDTTGDGLSKETAFATIQNGINTAINGDSVVVWPDVYDEEVDFVGKAITVRSADDEPAVVASSTDYAFTFWSGEDANSVLENFILAGGTWGILIEDSSPTLRNLTIADNEFGISVWGGSDPDITNCIFWNNEYGDYHDCEPDSDSCWLLEEDGPVAYWKFDEPIGSTAYDEVGYNDGTINGATRTTSGKMGSALSFDGTDDYVETTYEDGPVEYSISLWYKLAEDIDTSTSDIFRTLVSKTADEAPLVEQWAFWFNTYNGGLVLQNEKTQTNYAIVSYTPPMFYKDEWHHAVITASGIEGKIYFDGELKNTVNDDFVTGAWDDSVPVNIGSPYFFEAGRYFNGEIDEVAIYDRALSAKEVERLYKGSLANRAYHEPLFADSAAGDYHLLSERGRYWPAHDMWVLDKVTSDCVDGGVSTDDPADEPLPSGAVINMGAYGGTARASMSDWPVQGDINKDGVCNMADFAIMAQDWLWTADWIE